PTIGRLSTKSAPVPKVEFREEVANVALPELLEQRGLSERGTLRGERGRWEGDKPLKRLPSMSQADGRKLAEFDGVQSSIHRNDEVIRMCHLSLPKMLSVANAFKISDHQYNPANPAKGCHNVTCPVAGEITIRQPQAPRSGVCAFSVRRNRSHSSPHRPTRAKDRLAFTLDLWPTSVRVSF